MHLDKDASCIIVLRDVQLTQLKQAIQSAMLLWCQKGTNTYFHWNLFQISENIPDIFFAVHCKNFSGFIQIQKSKKKWNILMGNSKQRATFSASWRAMQTYVFICKIYWKAAPLFFGIIRVWKACAQNFGTHILFRWTLMVFWKPTNNTIILKKCFR